MKFYFDISRTDDITLQKDLLDRECSSLVDLFTKAVSPEMAFENKQDRRYFFFRGNPWEIILSFSFKTQWWPAKRSVTFQKFSNKAVIPELDNFQHAEKLKLPLAWGVVSHSNSDFSLIKLTSLAQSG